MKGCTVLLLCLSFPLPSLTLSFQLSLTRAHLFQRPPFLPLMSVSLPTYLSHALRHISPSCTLFAGLFFLSSPHFSHCPHISPFLHFIIVCSCLPLPSHERTPNPIVLATFRVCSSLLPNIVFLPLFIFYDASSVSHSLFDLSVPVMKKTHTASTSTSSRARFKFLAWSSRTTRLNTPTLRPCAHLTSG